MPILDGLKVAHSYNICTSTNNEPQHEIFTTRMKQAEGSTYLTEEKRSICAAVSPVDFLVPESQRTLFHRADVILGKAESLDKVLNKSICQTATKVVSPRF